MKLSKFDNKFISFIDENNNLIEGYCIYNNKDYTYHEYGVNEESIQIEYILFYKSQINKIKELKENNTPYSSFTEAYGYLEKMIIEAGPDIIEEVFEPEDDADNIHVYRLLLCIDDYIKKDLIEKQRLVQIKKLIEELITYNSDPKVNKIAKRIKNKIK